MSFGRDFLGNRFNSFRDFTSDSPTIRTNNRSPSSMFFERPIGSAWPQNGTLRENFGSPDLRERFGMSPGMEIPIRVIHEKHNGERTSPNDEETETEHPTVSSSGSRDDESGSWTGPHQAEVHEPKTQPRVHHIPIMVEPRDRSPGAPRSRSSSGSSHRSAPASNGISNTQQFSVGSPNSVGNFSSPKASPPQARRRHDSTGHVIPIKVEHNLNPVPNQSSPRVPVSPAKAKSMSPSPGLNNSKRTVPSGGCGPSTTQYGPHVTQIPVHHERRNFQSESQSQTPPPKTSKPDALDVIKSVDDEVAGFEKEVNEFSGEYQDKRYRYLDEMLTRCMIKLDSVEVNGREDVRKARKEALNRIHKCINVLESRTQKAATVGVALEAGDPPAEGNQVNDNSIPTDGSSVAGCDDSMQVEAAQVNSSDGQASLTDQPSSTELSNSVAAGDAITNESMEVNEECKTEASAATEVEMTPGEEVATATCDSQVEPIVEKPNETTGGAQDVVEATNCNSDVLVEPVAHETEGAASDAINVAEAPSGTKSILASNNLIVTDEPSNSGTSTITKL